MKAIVGVVVGGAMMLASGVLLQSGNAAAAGNWGWFLGLGFVTVFLSLLS